MNKKLLVVFSWLLLVRVFTVFICENSVTGLPPVKHAICTLATLFSADAVASTTQGKKIASVDDLKDKRIGVLLGSVHDSYAMKTFPNATILQYKTPSDIVLAVKTGKVDAAIYTYETLRDIFRTNDDLAILGSPLFSVPVGIGFNKTNNQLREQFNDFLRQIKKNGIYDNMINRWIIQGDTSMPEIKNSKANGVLTVGIVSDKGLPFLIIKDNKLIGLDAELAERFAAYLGKELKMSDMEFGSLIPAVVSQKIDMISSTLMITDERKKQISFSDEYYNLRASFFALKKNIVISSAPKSNKFSSLEDLKNKRFAVFTGTVHDGFVSRKYPNAQLMRYESTADMVLALESNKVDVALLDVITAGVIIKHNPELGILQEDVLNMPLGVGFGKNADDLRQRFNNFLQAIRGDGTYDDMYKRWCRGDPEQVVMPEIANGTGQKYVLGVSVDDLPYVAFMNGKYVGFDIELLKRFAARENINLDIVPMEFASLVPALASGKVDIITDGIAISEERSRMVDFSASYMEFRTAAMAMKSKIARYDNQPVSEIASGGFIENTIESFRRNIILEERWRIILDGLKTTVLISVLSTLFGTLLGSLVCFMRMSKNVMLSLPAKLFISILRGTPVLVFLMLIFYVVFASVNIDPVLVAVIAFGMNFAAYVAEIFRTGITSIDKGQSEAGISLGFSKVRTFLYIILPQTIQRILPVYKGEFISLVKMTSIVGYIAVQDLTKASDIIRSRTFDAFFPLIMVAILYFIISWVLMLSLEYLERKTDPKSKRKQAVIA
ncbi:MAG: ABC transporter permease subunit [Chlorobium sp.]|nr:MAG: ABC transporter permease subunit [Chlorobium sp.]